MPAPRYGHVSLLVGKDGAPLSKRHGDPSLRYYRERGYAPEAIANHLFRLGHSTSEHGFLTLEQMAAAFDPTHSGARPRGSMSSSSTSGRRSGCIAFPSKVRENGSRRAAGRARGARGAGVRRGCAAQHRAAGRCARLGDIVFGDLPPLAADDEQVVRSAGAGYFSAAAQAAAAKTMI